MNAEDRKEAVLAVLGETYTPEGVAIWWNARNRLLGGRSAADCWDAGEYERVEAVAESLTGTVAT